MISTAYPTLTEARRLCDRLGYVPLRASPRPSAATGAVVPAAAEAGAEAVGHYRNDQPLSSRNPRLPSGLALVLVSRWIVTNDEQGSKSKNQKRKGACIANG